MCQYCEGTGKMVIVNGPMIRFQACKKCDVHKLNEKRAMDEMRELMAEVQERRKKLCI